MRSPAGSRRSPPTSRSRRPARPVPQVRRWQQIEIETAGELPTFFDELVAAGVGRPAGRRAAPPRAGERVGQDRRRAVRDVARGHARRRHRRLGDRARDATTRWSACARSTASTRTRSSRSAGSASSEERAARAAAAREIDPDADEADRHRPGQVRPAGRLRRRPRGVPGCDASGPAATSSSATS